MKRIFIASLISYSFLTFADEAGKVSVGIKFSPSLSFSRVSPTTFTDPNTTDKYDYDSNSAKLRFGIGVVVDYMIGENFGASTGINFLLNGSGYLLKTNNLPQQTFSYSNQYIQIPLLFKLQSGEIMDDMRIFLKVGPTIDYLVGARINGEKSTQVGTNTVNTTKSINALHSSLVFSPGIELKWKAGIKFILGFTYSRGLTNVDKSDSNKLSSVTGFEMNNDFMAIDLGVMF